MSASPIQLHSERAGRARQLSPWTVRKLIWRRISWAREFHWLFKGSLESYRGLGPDLEPARIRDPEDFFLRRLRFEGLGKAVLRDQDIPAFILTTDDQDLLLDLIELLHAEVVEKPLMVHPPECMDIEGFDKEAGQAIFREEMNEALAMASPPLELLPSGQIIEIDEAHRDLHREPLPKDAEVKPAIADPVEHAVRVYLARGATIEDKRSAVKQLADALEHLRPQIKEELLSNDERDLFRIANQFAIRHNKPDQRRDYDKGAWLDWMFHVFLATVRVVIAVRDSPAWEAASSEAGN